MTEHKSYEAKLSLDEVSKMDSPKSAMNLLKWDIIGQIQNDAGNPSNYDLTVYEEPDGYRVKAEYNKHRSNEK